MNEAGAVGALLTSIAHGVPDALVFVGASRATAVARDDARAAVRSTTGARVVSVSVDDADPAAAFEELACALGASSPTPVDRDAAAGAAVLVAAALGVDEFQRVDACVAAIDAITAEVPLVIEIGGVHRAGPGLRALLRAALRPVFASAVVLLATAEVLDGDDIAALHPRVVELGDPAPEPPEQLDGDLGRFADAVVVAGAVCDPRDVGDALGWRSARLMRVVDEATARGVVDATGHEFTCAEAAWRHRRYAALPATTRRALHAQFATAALRRDDPGRALPHLEALVALGDHAGATLTLDHAARIATRAPLRAARLLATASELVGDRPDSIAIEQVRAEALLAGGAASEAFDVASRLLDRCDDTELVARLHVVRTRAAIDAGRPLRDLVAELGVAADRHRFTDSEHAWLLGHVAFAQLVGGDFAEADETARRAVEVGRRSARADAAVLGIAVRLWRASFANEFARTRALIDELDAAARVLPLGHPTEVMVPFFAAMALCDLDELDAALERVRSGVIRVSSDAPWILPLYAMAAGNVHFLAGRWDDAVLELETGLALAADVETNGTAVFSRALLALIAYARGDDVDGARHLGAAQRALAAGGNPIGLNHLLVAQARFGTPGDLDEAWNLDRALGIVNDLRLFAADVVERALDLGDNERAGDVVEVMRAQSLLPGAPHSVIAAALRVGARRNRDGAAMEAAVEAYSRSPRVVDHAAALVDLAVVSASCGDTKRARDALRDACKVFDEIRAERFRADAAARLAPYGVRAPRRARPLGRGWDALTEIESAVVEQAVSGHSNRAIGAALFLSHRTVETHLQHVFTKLGVRNRIELAAAGQARSRTPTN